MEYEYVFIVRNGQFNFKINFCKKMYFLLCFQRPPAFYGTSIQLKFTDLFYDERRSFSST